MKDDVDQPLQPKDSNDVRSEILALAYLQENFMDDLELLQIVVAQFKVDGPPMIEAIKSALDAEDSTRLNKAGHALKGAASGVGAERITKIAAQLQHLSLPGSSDEARLLIDRITAALDEYLREIEKFIQDPASP